MNYDKKNKKSKADQPKLNDSSELTETDGSAGGGRRLDDVLRRWWAIVPCADAGAELQNRLGGNLSLRIEQHVGRCIRLSCTHL